VGHIPSSKIDSGPSSSTIQKIDDIDTVHIKNKKYQHATRLKKGRGKEKKGMKLYFAKGINHKEIENL